MRSIGLNGKAFYSFVISLCVCGSGDHGYPHHRNKRERIATILIAPFMTCSARLPIYTLIIAAFIPNQRFLGGLIGLRALLMLGLYVIGFLAALITAKMLNSSVMKASHAPFILELPQYGGLR